MNEKDQFVGITHEFAKSLGRYQGFTQFLKEGNNTITKEQIIARLVEIDDELEANIKKVKIK
jgi:hypothetical protein